MIQGRNFVAFIVFRIEGEGGAPLVDREDFRATVARISAGVYDVTLSDDTATADAVPILRSTPNGNGDLGNFVGINWLRTGAKVFRLELHPANLLSAGGGTGFAVAPADPAGNTIITFGLDRVDTV